MITWGMGPTLLSCMWPWCISRRLAWLGCFMIHFYRPVTQASRFLPASVNYPAHLGFILKIPVCRGQHLAVAAPGAGPSVHLFCPPPWPLGAGCRGQERKPPLVCGSRPLHGGCPRPTALALRRSLPSCRYLAFQALLRCFIASFQVLAGADVVPAAARSSWLLASEMRDLSPLDSWAGFGKQACWGVSAFCGPFFFA